MGRATGKSHWEYIGNLRDACLKLVEHDDRSDDFKNAINTTHENYVFLIESAELLAVLTDKMIADERRKTIALLDQI